ncbi:hypothetical protein FRC10_009033, partial [Ceratobasidium sp. 414]
MPLGALARCMLPLLAAVPPDAKNPFEHAPFTFPVYRANLNLLPLATDQQTELFEDEPLDVDVDVEDLTTSPVAAGDGLCFPKNAGAGLPPVRAAAFANNLVVRANHFYRGWLWTEITRLRALKYTVPEAIKRVDLVGPRTVLKDGRTDEGWGAYRQLTLASLHRPGGIMDLAKETMVRHRATPAEQWRDTRDENRRKVDGRPSDEYAVPIPSGAPFASSLPVLDEVAERVFGPEVVSGRGSVDSIYRECCKVIVSRVWQQMSGRLSTSIKKSKAMCATMDLLLADARESGAMADLVAALRHLKIWRATAVKTLEVGDPPFLSREKELGELFHSLGHAGEPEEAGEPVLLSRARALTTGEAGKKKSRGAKAGGRKGKSGSVLPSEAEMATAREHWNEYCQGLEDDQNCPVPVGPAQARFDLLDGDDEDVGMEELRDMSTEQLWASLGLPGATQFPFAKQGGAGGAGPRPKWHQIAGSLAILKGAFTAGLGQPARPTMLCDDVGLGKTLQIIGAISLIAHMREQQEQRPDKSLLPPPFAVENGTPYFAGLERIPNRPSLIVVPRTLASQWIQQLKAFTELGSFHILHFSNDVKSQSARYFSDPNGEYRKAMGPDNRNASKVIILAEMPVSSGGRRYMAEADRLLGHPSQAISSELARCFMPIDKRSGKAVQRASAKGDPDALRARTGVRLDQSIFSVQFNFVAYDESHALRTVTLLSLAALKLSAKALVCVGATATPIFTGPKDIASQGRVLRHAPMIGTAGQELHDRIVDEQRDRAREWDANARTLTAQAAKREGIKLATAAGALNDEARLDGFLYRAQAKFESPDQVKILRTSYVMRTSIDMLREAMLPIVLRRTGTSKDPSGKTVLDLRPYQTVTAWAPLRDDEQAELDHINEVHSRDEEGEEPLNWS